MDQGHRLQVTSARERGRTTASRRVTDEFIGAGMIIAVVGFAEGLNRLGVEEGGEAGPLKVRGS